MQIADLYGQIFNSTIAQFINPSHNSYNVLMQNVEMIFNSDDLRPQWPLKIRILKRDGEKQKQERKMEKRED